MSSEACRVVLFLVSCLVFVFVCNLLPKPIGWFVFLVALAIGVAICFVRWLFDLFQAVHATQALTLDDLETQVELSEEL